MSQLQVTGEAKIRSIQGPVVANSGVITALNGAASQYVRGDGTLADFPSSSGGGSSVSYYLNSSVSQGTIGGNAYRELSKDPIIGAGTDIAISSDGYVANYITDANDPDVVLVPGGNFNCEFYFSVNNNTGNPYFYAELYKYDGSTFTLLGSSVGVPEYINQGTIIAPYYFAIPVATAALAVTDRLAIRIYVNVDGRTVTLHTENSHLCQVVTTLSKGMVSLNNLTDQSQYLATGTSGTDFNIVSSGDTHTFNIPSASASNRGLITTGAQTIAGDKTFSGELVAAFLESTGGITSAFGIQTNYGITLTKTGQISGASAGQMQMYAPTGTASSISFQDGNTFYDSVFNFDNTSDRTYTFPAASGTLALTSDLSSYVPYTGATGAVNLGFYDLTVSGLKIGTGSGGTNNTRVGAISFISNTTGSYNTSLGAATLNANTTGNSNTAIGNSSLQLNTTGSYNASLGSFSLGGNTTGNYNTGVGYGTLAGNTTGVQNTAIGSNALNANTTGGANTAIGIQSLVSVTTGGNNIAIGANAGSSITTGNSNTIIGNYAGTAGLYANIVLADGLGNIRYQWNGSTNLFTSKLTVNTGGIDNQIAAIGTAPSLRLANAVTGATINGFIAMAGATNDYITGAVAGDMCIGNQNSGKIIYGFGSGTATAFMTITSTGLGIGTSSPSAALSVNGAATFSSSVTATKLTLSNLPSSQAIFINDDGGYIAGYNTAGSTRNGYLQFNTGGPTVLAADGSNYLSLNTNGLERFRITSGGNVGIGTSSPIGGVFKLQVGDGSADSRAIIVSNQVYQLGFRNGAGNPVCYDGSDTSGNRTFYNSAGGELMRITSGGNWLLGKTNDGFANQGNWFKANGETYSTIINSINTLHVYDATNSIFRFYVTGGGIINASSATISVISDQRLKENIQDLDTGLDAIMALKPRKYDWKKESGNFGKNIRGFIAQEFEEVFPDLIDISINPSPEGEEPYKQIRQDLIPVLVKAIQELKAEIDELKNK